MFLFMYLSAYSGLAVKIKQFIVVKNKECYFEKVNLMNGALQIVVYLMFAQGNTELSPGAHK